MVAAFVATDFAQDDAKAASTPWRQVADQLRPKAPKLANLMDEAEPDVLVYMTFPRKHRPKLHSTNPLECLNGEIKRRTNVVGIFPDDDAITRLFGAFLLAYGILRGGSELWHQPGEPALGIPFTALLTFLLICSSVTMVLSHAALLEKNVASAKKFLALTVLGGVLFLAGQMFEYFGRVMFLFPLEGHGLVHEGLIFGQSHYATTFYLITSFHGMHVFSGVVIKTQRKALPFDRDQSQDNWEVRTHPNGWIYIRQGDEEDLNAAAIEAVAALGLDFGAVDICTKRRGDSRQVYVLEVNTAPGLEGQTLAAYTDAIERQL